MAKSPDENPFRFCVRWRILPQRAVFPAVEPFPGGIHLRKFKHDDALVLRMISNTQFCGRATMYLSPYFAMVAPARFSYS
jgi:hypothetical protein